MAKERNVRVSTRIDAPLHELFVLVSRYEHAARVIDGLEGVTPVGSQTDGVGARFSAVMRLGPKRVAVELEIDELDEDRLVRWRSSKGDERAITFELNRLDGTTAVRLTVAYERPESLGAVLMSPVVEQAVRERARASLERLRELSTAGAR